MAKTISIQLDEHQAKVFFRPVRDKQDVITLWMHTIKAFLVNQPPNDPNKIGAVLTIVVRSMSRLFCELKGGNKIFSITFPFAVRTQNNQKTFISRSNIHIDNRLSSEILALTGSSGKNIFDVQEFSDFIDPVFDALDTNPSIWALVRELMLAEDGYLRYDNDPARVNGHIHPEHHLDLCYSSSGTFKVGLHSSIGQDTLMAILNTETSCHYLSPAEQA